jgi:phosphatidate cytidylyltransferase
VKKRILTGVLLGLAVLIGTLYLPNSFFRLVAFIVLLVACWEWFGLLDKPNLAVKFIYSLIVVILMYISLSFPVVTVSISLLWWIVGFFFVFRSSKQIKYINKNLRYIIGLFVIVPSFVALSLMQAYSPMLLIYVLLVITVADSGAYFIGRKYGKNKLAPVISPKKTIEGLLGGLVLSAVVSGIFSLYFPMGVVNRCLLLIIGVIIVFFALLGDLFESLLKRVVGIKDSGNILPGHGGILDRLDSVFSALPVFVFFVYIFNLFPALFVN